MENVTLTVRRKKEKPKDNTVGVCGEVYEVLRLYSEQTEIPVKQLVDILLRYALDNVEVVFEDENEVS